MKFLFDLLDTVGITVLALFAIILSPLLGNRHLLLHRGDGQEAQKRLLILGSREQQSMRIILFNINFVRGDGQCNGFAGKEDDVAGDGERHQPRATQQRKESLPLDGAKCDHPVANNETYFRVKNYY